MQGGHNDSMSEGSKQDWRDARFVGGREWSFRPKVLAGTGQAPPPAYSARAAVEAANRGGLSPMDMEMLSFKAKTPTKEDLDQTFDLGRARDIWWGGDKLLIPSIPHCLKAMFARVAVQAFRLVRTHPGNVRAWDIMEAVPFLLLQRWDKCRADTRTGANILATRFLRFMCWDLEELAREASELQQENRIP